MRAGSLRGTATGAARAAWVALAAPLALVVLVWLAAPAQAHPETAAPTLRPDVVRAWHEPEVVPPHTQWQGYLQFTAHSNVTAAAYQICEVGRTCFAPPTPARAAGEGLFWFDTEDYTVNGRPVDYEAGWRLGVKWYLTESRADGNVTVQFPGGPDLGSPECAGDAALACSEAHYLAFDLPAASQGAPGAGAVPLLVLLVAVAVALRRRA